MLKNRLGWALDAGALFSGYTGYCLKIVLGPCGHNTCLLLRQAYTA